MPSFKALIEFDVAPNLSHLELAHSFVLVQETHDGCLDEVRNRPIFTLGHIPEQPIDRLIQSQCHCF